MAVQIEIIPSGTITSPEGFYAGAVSAGIKAGSKGKLDLGVLFSEASCTAAGLFTSNRIKAAPVILCQERLRSAKPCAIVVNSGCANACTGKRGLRDAEEMAVLVAEGINIAAEEVLVASTGVIGKPLPMKRIRENIELVILSTEGGHELAQAMMTTDTVPKEIAVKVKVGDSEFTIAGVAKGSGMIHPNLATMLCFLTTDAMVEPAFLKRALKEAVDGSLNMVSVDGDTSTNDTVLILANGMAESRPIRAGSENAGAFQEGLNQVCTRLAKKIARDGEGATKLIEVTVSGAPTVADARLAARTVVNSPLVKTAVYGNDLNWGRIMAALGRSGVEVTESEIDLYIGDVCLLKGGKQPRFDKKKALALLRAEEVPFGIDLNQGTAKATAWGCDLTEKYVFINGHYTT